MSNGALLEELQEADLLQCAVCRSTLQDAVLLTCLHSVCRSCACDATVHVMCPWCRVPTDISTANANVIVSTLVHRSQLMKNVFSCTHCAADNEQGTSSVVWCYSCQQSLCLDCEKHHKRFNSNHNLTQLDEHTVLSELYRPPSRMCTKHDLQLTLVCFTCRDGRCFKCAHDCYTACHEVQLIDSPAAIDRLKERITDVTRVISNLSSTELLLQAHLSLPENVAGALEESLAVLRIAKKKAVDSISKAYDKSEQSLFESWEVLASKADTIWESANNLKKRLDWASIYCQVALQTVDMTSLLPQLDALSSGLSSLLDEARKVKPPVDPLKLISMNVCLPHDLDLITRDWFGTATVASDDFSCSRDDIANEVTKDYYARRVSALSELEELIKKHKEQQESFERDRLEAQQQLVSARNDVKALLEKQNAQQEQLAHARRTVVQRQSEAALMKPLSFHSSARGTFKGPGRCWDVAVTPQHTLLVAAGWNGLKEYNATSFREMATWKPDGDRVRTVDLLSDGRAVVGLYAKQVVVLRRSTVGDSSAAGAWRVERLLAELQSPPRRLSAWGDHLLAVLEDGYDESKKLWLPGLGLVLLSLCDDGKQLHRQQLDYIAGSVALTDRCVIVTNRNQVGLSGVVGWVGYRGQCFVDCYSHLGVKLWRREVGGGINFFSVCSDSVGRVLYAAVRGQVVALSVDDGRELIRAIELSAKETEGAYAVALGGSRQRLLALISLSDKEPNLVTIFSVA